MNKTFLMGRLTRDPEVRYSAGENSMAIARYTIAVDRRFKRDGKLQQTLSDALLLEDRLNLQKNIFVRVSRSLSAAGSRQAAM